MFIYSLELILKYKTYYQLHLKTQSINTVQKQAMPQVNKIGSLSVVSADTTIPETGESWGWVAGLGAAGVFGYWVRALKNN